MSDDGVVGGTEPKPLMCMYAVKNAHGEYFRAKGFGGCGDTWVSEISKARIYPRPGPARARITFFATHFPKYGVPKLVALNVTSVTEVDETVRVKKAKDRKDKEMAERECRRRERERQSAEKRLSEAQETLRRLGVART